MTPARVPMSVPLLLEHVHGDPCPVVHAAVMSNRERPGVRPWFWGTGPGARRPLHHPSSALRGTVRRGRTAVAAGPARSGRAAGPPGRHVPRETRAGAGPPRGRRDTGKALVEEVVPVAAGADLRGGGTRTGQGRGPGTAATTPSAPPPTVCSAASPRGR